MKELRYFFDFKTEISGSLIIQNNKMVGILNGGFGQANTQAFCIDFLQIQEEL